MSTRLFNRATPPHILTLVTAAAAGSLAMNVFLPSLPGIARHFDADYAVVQLVVSLYLAATAVLQIAIGPASDRFGRRPVMLFSFTVFIVSTIAAVMAPTIEALLACRFFQAFAAAGIAVPRAIVRDMVGPHEAASRIGYITMGMTLAPMLGPVVGGYLDELYGWQSTFNLMLVTGCIALVVIYLDLGETNPKVGANRTSQIKAYVELFRSRRFWGYAATAAFASGAFFAFLGGGPYVATDILYLSPSEYGLYFVLISVGYMLGNFLSGRYSRRFGINPMMVSGNLLAAGGMLLSIALFSVGLFHPLSLFGPAFFVGVGNGLTLPNANAGIVSVRPHLAGAASGLGGALQIGGGAALSVAAGALLSVESGPFPLLWVMFLSSLAAILSTLYVMHVARHWGEI